MTLFLIYCLACSLALLLMLYRVAVWLPLFWCRRFHKKHHTIRQMEYGSFYYVHCSKCDWVFPEYRQ